MGRREGEGGQSKHAAERETENEMRRGAEKEREKAEGDLRGRGCSINNGTDWSITSQN